ncbi:left-right determination factor 2-like [Melozone crissalis]|uniref:left-right determination factor 2-like n=1 Tax=Melozone crissalis TaxID=40204 RepID=UPI0023DB185C|nr:left-right determination factor 2-like [Melozone crissalis]
MDLRCAWMLCVLCLVPTAPAFTQERFKEAVLKQLGLSEVPKLHSRDLVDVVIPEHVKNKYMSMLKRQRVKRRALPSLAGILRATPGHTGMAGEVLYTDTTTRQRLVFDMEGRIPKNNEVTMAELKLFKKPVDRAKLPARQSHRPVSNARVSVYCVQQQHDGTNSTSLIDSRLVPIRESGWKSFDVTQAVHYWLRSKGRGPMLLEVRIEGERPGSHASEMARAVRFTSQHPGDRALGKPELVLYTLDLDDYGSSGDCREEALLGKSTCCRQQHYISLRDVPWVLEPAGFQAFRCSGPCLQPPRHSGPRSCAAAASSALPIIYLVRRGNHTEVEAAELPNMIVERCSCVADGVALV